MPHVLLADSDTSSLHHLSDVLVRARYHVSQAEDGRNVMRSVARQTPDLVILDTLLSDEAGYDQSGYDVCRRIRRTSDVPIMFVSSQANAEDCVKGLKLGADDFLAKPCAPAELLARVGAVLRRADRARQPPTTEITLGGWRLNPVKQVCQIEDGREYSLTPREVHLLSFLMRRIGHVCTNHQIVRHVWGYAGQQARSIVATSVWRLRAKLEQDAETPRHLITVRNLGYKFEA